jgi:hypothetical protein
MKCATSATGHLRPSRHPGVGYVRSFGLCRWIGAAGTRLARRGEKFPDRGAVPFGGALPSRFRCVRASADITIGRALSIANLLKRSAGCAFLVRRRPFLRPYDTCAVFAALAMRRPLRPQRPSTAAASSRSVPSPGSVRGILSTVPPEESKTRSSGTNRYPPGADGEASSESGIHEGASDVRLLQGKRTLCESHVSGHRGRTIHRRQNVARSPGLVSP